jgi:hypothetical protein
MVPLAGNGDHGNSKRAGRGADVHARCELYREQVRGPTHGVLRGRVQVFELDRLPIRRAGKVPQGGGP